MKHIFSALAVIIATALCIASPAAAFPDLVRGTVFSGEYANQMIVKNVRTGEVMTRAELEAQGVDIFDAKAVHAVFDAKYSAGDFTGDGRTIVVDKGPDGIAGTDDDRTDQTGSGKSW
ncbi:hypothetical protein [uncultured Pelagimonas sp.]|uniref:hypothetical protein n=1 Tax=uncultured Pelagimonas sp. TaxID=1618102 RepID=UPI00262A073F|nr:hypothetical protein [uncultured Pelagimonas sp.]